MLGVAAAIRICCKALGKWFAHETKGIILLQRTLPCILEKYLWPKYISQPLVAINCN